MSTPADTCGYYAGKHYTDYVEAVKSLKREGRTSEALELLTNLIEATESESRHHPGWGVAPWYYEQLAILHAKRGEHDAELEVLERYASQPHAPGRGPARLAERLAKARIRQR